MGIDRERPDLSVPLAMLACFVVILMFTVWHLLSDTYKLRQRIEAIEAQQPQTENR